MRAIPGVERVAHSPPLPLLNNGGWDQWMTVEGYKTAENETIDPIAMPSRPDISRRSACRSSPAATSRSATCCRWRSPGTTIRAVAIVTESFAKRYFKDGRADRHAHRHGQGSRHEADDRDHRHRQGLALSRREGRSAVCRVLPERSATAARCWSRHGCGGRGVPGDPRRRARARSEPARLQDADRST